ncbi:unnamed protein product, partial [Pylaiella littoralis]
GTVEATDRFGSVLTLRLVRQCDTVGCGSTFVTNAAAGGDGGAVSMATFRMVASVSAGCVWVTAVVIAVSTTTPLFLRIPGTIFNCFFDGERQRLSRSRNPTFQTVITRPTNLLNMRRKGVYDLRRASSFVHIAAKLQAFAADTKIKTKMRTPFNTHPAFFFAVAQCKSKKDCRGLKYLGTISNNFQEESVEIFLGSFHQQALIAEAKRVLSQPRNRGLGVELMPGVAAVGVGRNSIGAVVTTSRPHKKVTLDMSASLTERECPDPEGYISTTLAVIEDETGVSNLFVLNLCDTSNIQDPWDGRTSLMTAVLDNDETLVERLLAEGVDIDICDAQKRTALLHSVISKHDNITHLILAHHSGLVRSQLNNTRKVRNIVTNFIRRGRLGRTERRGAGLADSVSDRPQAMLDQRDVTGKAALHHAVADTEERHKIVSTLLAAKAKVNVKDARGSSPLHIACQLGHVHIVNTLIVYSASLGSKNAELMTPLHIASLNFRTKIVSVLLRENQGAMVMSEDARGWTPLHYACRTLATPERSASRRTEQDNHDVREGAEEASKPR